ncbi:MAG: divalent-cation tolerance protein CutA [Erythrobacter sp.]
MSGDDPGALVWSPFPDSESARKAARIMLVEGLVACANILPGVQSVFLYESNARTANEVVAVLKTRAAMLDIVIARLGALHPYETPAILGWRADVAHPATSGWLEEAISGSPST